MLSRTLISDLRGLNRTLISEIYVMGLRSVTALFVDLGEHL